MSELARGVAASDEVADRLHSAAIHLLRLLRREDAVTGLSPARLSALSVLVFGGPRTLGELASAEGVRSPTMSRLVAEMDCDGLIARAPAPGDGRAVVLSATEEGRRVLLAGRRRRVAALAARLEGLDEGSLHVLHQAAAIVERVAGDDSAGIGS